MNKDNAGTSTGSPLTRWPLLHSKLPAAAIKSLPKDVYGVTGLSDVNEGYLIQRLFASGMDWDWRIVKQEYLGAEDRPVRDKDYTLRYYLAAVHGELNIEGRMFHGSGASDNRKVDAAYKGAATVAFKNACKLAGLTIELYKDGKAMDHIYEARQTSKAESVSEIVEWAEGASGSDQREGRASGVAIQESPAAETQAPRQPTETTETGELDLTDLLALGRTLRTPVTNLQIKNQVAEHGVEGVRRRLVLAHARDHGPACEHVAQLAGLARAK